MHIIVAVKQFGARQSALGDRRIEIAPVKTLRELLIALVDIEVDAYNAKPEGAVDDSGPLTFIMPLTPLAHKEIEDKAATGKIGFGRRYGKKAKTDMAEKTVINAFRDGLFKVFCGEDEIAELDAPLALKDGDRLMFLPLVFLKGGGR